MGRAYLARLARAKLRVRRLIHMTPRPGMLAKLAPRNFRSAMAAAKQHHAAHFWPVRLAQTYPGLYRNMTEKIGDAFGVDQEFFDEIRRNDDLEKYADTVLRVEMDDLRDPALLDALSAEETKELLFTGGGILPKTLFAIPGIRLLHVHPGCLPDVRGADGLLWSMMIRGRPGASCFLMAPGLDEGDLVEVREYSPLTFLIPGDETPDEKTLYRMLFSYFDPVLRADLLVCVLEKFKAPTAIFGNVQNLDVGVTFHFMEDRMRHFALSLLFKRD